MDEADTNRAVLYDETGGPEVLRIAEVPDPIATDGRVVVRVYAVGLNPYDAKARSGTVPLQSPFPRGLGSDFAGTVVEVGAHASYHDESPVHVGDEVLGWGGATLRRLLAVASTQLVRKPVGVPFTVAGSLSTPGQTAAASLRTVPVGAGDTVLVGAASGSVGFLYSQLAIAAGARVIGTASTTNHERLRAIGVTPVAYGPGLVDRVRQACPDGLSAAQDNVGRETVDTALALGVPAERICTIVDYAAAEEFGIRTPGRFPRSAQTLEGLVRRVAAGTLRLPIQRVFAIDEVVSAFTLMEGRHLTGKVVVEP